MLGVASTAHHLLALLGVPVLRPRPTTVHADRARRASEEADHRPVLDAAPAALLTVDADGRVLDANRTGAEWFGHDRVQSGELRLRDLFASGGCPSWEEAAADPVRVTVNTVAGEPIEVTVTEIGAAGGGHRLLWLSDDRRCRRLERRLGEAQARVEQLDRACALGALGAAAAHELTQPLAAAALHAEVAEATLRTGDVPGAATAIEATMAQLSRAATLLRRLRVFAGSIRPEMEWVAARSLVAEVEELAGPSLRQSGTALTIDVADEAGDLLVDPIQMQQVLLNLILNAVDAVRGGERRALHLTIRLHAPGHACVTLRDSGAGVADSVRSRLFAPFVSSKRDGLGLGLATSRAIVEAHGGELWHEDTDEGACFLLTVQRRPGVCARDAA